MQPLLLRLLILLLLFPPPCHPASTPNPTHPHPQPIRQQQLPSFHRRRFIIILIDGQTTHEFEHHFTLNSPIPSNLSESQVLQFYNETLTTSNTDRQIISSASFSYITPVTDNRTLIVSCVFSFHSLAGRAHATLAYTEPNSSNPHQAQFIFDVVGIVLYSLQPGSPPTLAIHSGLASTPLQLPTPDRNSPQTRTVNASVYAGPAGIEIQSPHTLHQQNIQLSVTTDTTSGAPPNPSRPNDGSQLLPWNPDECSVFLPASQLDHRCSMAFSPEFTQFTIRVPRDQGLRREVRVNFVWPGLAQFSSAVNEFEGNVEGGLAGFGEMETLDSDRLSFVIVNDEGNAGEREVTAGLEDWKVAVVVVVLVLVLIASVVLICCYCGCGKWETDTDTGKPVLKGWIGRMGWWAYRFRLGRYDTGSDIRKCYVQEPSSVGNLTVLMLGNSARSLRLAEGEREISTDGQEISREGDGGSGAERLVLAGVVTRGIDLEPSTEGGSYRFPLSEEGLSFGPDSLAAADGLPGADATDDEHGERISEYEDESRMTGAETTIDRSGVGAAINRVRQLDMLKGPVSKGLLEEVGKVSQGDVGQGQQAGSQRGACPLSASTVS